LREVADKYLILLDLINGIIAKLSLFHLIKDKIHPKLKRTRLVSHLYGVRRMQFEGYDRFSKSKTFSL
jgi:hypothetical protein